VGERYFYIRTFGCQMNVHDSEKIATLLKQSGYNNTEDIEKADLILINTCSIREKAENKVYSELGRFRKLKTERPDIIIAVGGCLAQQRGAAFLKKYPYVNIVFGTHQIHRIIEFIETAQKEKSAVIDTALQESVKSLDMMAKPNRGQIRAFVAIMQGCNNYCSYCVVPYVRGREESRYPLDIVYEIRKLAADGLKEVILLGQNVNSYGAGLGNEHNFPALLHKIKNIKGIERIRFTTSHPKDLSEELMNCFVDIEELCEHIHLPVQSGSDTILQAMNRNYTVSDYLDKVEKLRSICPGISITSDFIVGFPGETDADFQSTLDLMEKIRFDGCFSFKYSERVGTAAAGIGGKVAESVKLERLRLLQSIQDSHALERNSAMIGRHERILIEDHAKNSQEDVMGRTQTNKIVNIKGKRELIGKVVSVAITEAYQHSLKGNLL
jgi:tRNA-2-methylthio-N6-dimethylallyladenosine synthase